MEQIDVRILDREYRLSVTPEDKDRLVRAAQMVDSKMRAIRDSGRVTSTDRIAVLAALQFAHQILGNGNDTQAQQAAEVSRRLRKINDTLETELRQQENLF
ncbi:MAG: cell division protein ZapA [Burkholderiaceae bacterium]|jgi:cell division protein ZapA|nr:cell division protein ZapA [Betaproteobacteria bacterium]